VGGEVGGGDLAGLEQERGAFEVHVIAGEAGGDLGDGVLDGGAVVEAGELERVVLQDGGEVFDAVLEAHDFVVHGAAAAAISGFFAMVHALVRDGGFAAVFLVDGHLVSFRVDDFWYVADMVEVAARCVLIATGMWLK
jgi:hypothetical protein